jgi:hypothetical protein
MDGVWLIPENGRFAAPTQSVCKMAERRAGKRYIRAIANGPSRFFWSRSLLISLSFLRVGYDMKLTVDHVTWMYYKSVHAEGVRTTDRVFSEQRTSAWSISLAS